MVNPRKRGNKHSGSEAMALIILSGQQAKQLGITMPAGAVCGGQLTFFQFSLTFSHLQNFIPPISFMSQLPNPLPFSYNFTFHSLAVFHLHINHGQEKQIDRQPEVLRRPVERIYALFLDFLSQDRYKQIGQVGFLPF